MITKLMFVIVVISSSIGVRATTRPNTIVERSITIGSSSEGIFPLIHDVHHFARWSPRQQLSPAMQRSVTNNVSGSGSVYKWSGNSKADAERMEIMEATPPARAIAR